MKQANLAAAFELIYEFRNGRFKQGAPISRQHQKLLRLLCEDLLPGKSFDPAALEELIPLLAKTDSSWNKRTMALVDEFYALREAGRQGEADQRRAEFLSGCPSSWYRNIVSSL